MQKKAIAIIPARYNSTRFKGKSLALLKGKPVIQHVYESVRKSRSLSDTIIATDDKRIFKAVQDFSGKALMTSSEHRSGTDRIAEIAKKLDYSIIVNVQGDEPLIKESMVNDVVELLSDKRAHIATLVRKIENKDELADKNIVKAVIDKEGFALYFSRFPIPFNINMENDTIYYKHVGIYCYRRDVLLSLTKMPQSPLEKAESLEQLRALENGFKIKVKETKDETIGVDTPGDLEKAEKWLNTYL